MQLLQLLLDSSRGIYIPKAFYEDFDFAAFGLDKENYSELSDIDNEFYWETWEVVLDCAKTEQGYMLCQDGDLWLVDYNACSYGDLVRLDDDSIGTAQDTVSIGDTVSIELRNGGIIKSGVLAEVIEHRL